MLSKNRLKYIRSLKHKKNRDEQGQFVAEGDKIVMELLALVNRSKGEGSAGKEARSNKDFIQIDQLIATSAWLKKNILRHTAHIREITEVSEKEFDQITMLESPTGVMALLDMPVQREAGDAVPAGISLALETIQDPGNLGTILRTALWFGIEAVYCSPDCVDCYNPKVVQSSMGAILHMPVFYTPLPELLRKFSENPSFKVYGTFLSGEPIWETELGDKALVVLGNESRGISNELLPYIPGRLNIPPHRLSGIPPAQGPIESLNVAAAAAIVCAAFRRQSSR